LKGRFAPEILRDDPGAAFLPRSHSLKHCLAISSLIGARNGQ